MRIINYFRRLERWATILPDVRPQGLQDALALYGSAAMSPLTSLAGLDEWRDPVLMHDAVINVKGVGRFRLRGRTDDFWHVVPLRERAIFAFLDGRLRPGDVFVDAGANIGVYSVMAAQRLGPKGRVVAFEMMPQTAERLAGNLEANGLGERVEIVRAALSAESGATVDVYMPAAQHGQASIANPETRQNKRIGSVVTTTLDEELAQVEKIDVLKIDIEGAEEMALRGAEKTLAKTEHVVFEDWGKRSEVSSLLEEAGFAITRLDGSNALATSCSAQPRRSPNHC